MRRVLAVLKREMPQGLVNGKWTYKTMISTVRVMARAEGYAMVRNPGARPFVVRENELHPITAGDSNGR